MTENEKISDQHLSTNNVHSKQISLKELIIYLDLSNEIQNSTEKIKTKIVGFKATSRDFWTDIGCAYEKENDFFHIKSFLQNMELTYFEKEEKSNIKLGNYLVLYKNGKINIDCQLFRSIYICNDPCYEFLIEIKSLINDFDTIFKCFEQIVNYLDYAENINYIFETLELEQIIFNGDQCFILPIVQLIQDGYFIDSCNNSKIKFQTFTDGEAPEIYNNDIINDKRKFVVYSLGILVLKIIKLVSDSDITQAISMYKSLRENNILISAAQQIHLCFNNYPDSLKLSKFENLIISCLSFVPEKRPYLSEIKNSLIDLNNSLDSTLISININEYESPHENISINNNYKKYLEEKRNIIATKKIEHIYYNVDYSMDENFYKLMAANSVFLDYICQRNKTSIICNFLFKKLTALELNVLKYVVGEESFKIDELKLVSTSFKGRVKTKGTTANDIKKLFKEGKKFNLLLDIISKSNNLSILKTDGIPSDEKNGIKLVEALQKLTSLKNLSVNEIPLNEKALEKLTNIHSFNKLLKLYLYSCRIGNKGLNIICNKLNEFNNIETLNLGDNDLKINKSNLIKNEIINFFEFIYRSKESKIKNLNLNQNKFDNESLNAIITNLNKESLQKLSLGFLYDPLYSIEFLLNELSKSHSFKYLDISQNDNTIKFEDEKESIHKKNIQLINNISKLQNLCILCLNGWIIKYKEVFSILSSVNQDIFKEIYLIQCKFIPVDQHDFEVIPKIRKKFPKFKIITNG